MVEDENHTPTCDNGSFRTSPHTTHRQVPEYPSSINVGIIHARGVLEKNRLQPMDHKLVRI